MNFIGIITGPTSVGKTDFILKLAELVPIEVINADVGQFYTPLSIGTAKPDWRHEKVPHHLFDILDTPRSLTVIEYRTLVDSLIKECWQRNTIPFVVGGSLFYIQSLLFPPFKHDNSPIDQQVTGENHAWDLLHTIDPLRAAQIHKNDQYRISRALTLWYQSGKLPSLQKPRYSPLAPYFILWCTRNRDDLYARIDQRVKHMMDAGWLNEVRGLEGTAWIDFLRGKKIIGYDDCISYLNSPDKDLKKLIATIAQKTRHYAKRQETFWRGLKKKIPVQENNQERLPQTFELDLTFLDLDLYIKQLSFLILSLQKKVHSSEK